jgi:ribosomal protein L16 Arg81 hydroxylase
MQKHSAAETEELRGTRGRRELYAFDLGYVLAPFSQDDFLTKYVSQHFLHIAGRHGKFDGLLTWPAVNDILRHQDLRSSLKIVQDGKTLQTESLFRPRLSTSAVTALLRGGATMIISEVDHMHEPVTVLCQQLERVLRADVRANAYAGWRTTKGFDIHRDDHDVLVLQLAGKKHWRVYGETERYALTKSSDKIDRPPIWEDVLNDGDTLYIPRGWWHVATPCDEPSLHLTVGIYNVNGIDLLRWVTERLKEEECFRMDLPRFRDDAAQAACLSELQQRLMSVWCAPDILERFLRDMDLKALPRSAFGLPWSATREGFPIMPDHVVELATPRHLYLQSSNEEEITIECDRARFCFDVAAKPVIDYLNHSGPVSVRLLCDIFGAEIDEAALVSFLSDLARLGIVTLTMHDG